MKFNITSQLEKKMHERGKKKTTQAMYMERIEYMSG